MIQTGTINLNISTGAVAFDLEAAGTVDTGTIQMASVSGSPWTASVVTVKRSNDGINWHALETAVTITAPSITNQIDLRGFRYLGFEVTTPEGAASQASFVVYAKQYGR